MPKGVANKRYTPEFKKLLIETMWVTDVTEFRLFGEKLYLSSVNCYICKSSNPWSTSSRN